MMRAVNASLVLVLSLATLLAGCGSDGPGTASADDAARACATSYACGLRFAGAYGRTGVSGCAVVLSQLNDRATAAAQLAGPRELRCLAGAADCAAARRCLNGGADPQSCTGALGGCNGDMLVFCSPQGDGTSATARFDCASAGRRCSGPGAGAYPYCAGEAPATDDGAPACSDPGAVVDLYHYDGLRCDGADTLVVCRAGHEARVDCRALGLGCFATRDTDRYNPSVGYDVARCAVAADCDPFTTAATCDGSKLTFCANGALFTVDCASRDGAGCDPAQGGRCTK
jgi:hypothetical protein